MEEDGIKLDHASLTSSVLNFWNHADTGNQATELAGEAFNIASPKQVGEVLFDKLGIKGGKKTATGQYSTSVLEKNWASASRSDSGTP